MVGQGEIPIVHDQSLFVTETRAAVDVGLGGAWSAGAMLPVRAVWTSIRYLDGAGDEVMLTEPDTHHRDERVSGIGDPLVTVGRAWTPGPWRIAARAGASLPLGRTEDDPFALGDAGLSHQHIQMGTGTVNPVAAVEATRAYGPWTLAGLFFTQQVIFESGRGYQAGDRYAGGVSLRRGLGAWNLRGGLEAQGETAERWGGVVHTDDGNRGRFDAMIAVGARWSASAATAVDIGLRIPVVTHVVGGQLDMPAILEVGVSWAFGMTRPTAAQHEDEHDHGHEHDDEHGDDEHGHDEHGHDEHGHDEHGHDEQDVTGLDLADLGPPGAAVELTPVPGKVTIIDYWAVWCAPCEVLQARLIELARAHPDRVAIRRVDVVDWDTEVVERDLTPGGYGMPHVKVFDASRTLVLERSADAHSLDALVDAVRAVVEAE